MRIRWSPGLKRAVWMAVVVATSAPLARGAEARSTRKPSAPGRLQRAAATVQSEDTAAGGAPSATTGSTDKAAATGGAEGLQPPASSFEEVLARAEPLEDLGALLIAPTGGCEEVPSSIERARCEGTRAFLRRTIPGRWFSTIGDDPEILRVSGFDPEVKGYRLSIAGCLACSKPWSFGDPVARVPARYVTLRTPPPLPPSAASPPLREAVELNRSTVGFDSQGEAQAWWGQSEGNLQTQFVFAASPVEWTASAGPGTTLPLLGFRVFNRCTREVLVSRPPSTGDVQLAVAPDCLEQKRSTRTKKSAPVEAELPSSLSAQDLATAMAGIRPQVAACYARYQVPGRALLDYVVASNGLVQTVRLSGIFAGTPTGECVTEAARGARFPRFTTVRQQFSYPFFLRAE